MRFMMIVKHAEKQSPPHEALMDAIAKLSDEAAKAGTMLGSGGLGRFRSDAKPNSGFWECDFKDPLELFRTL